LIPRLREHAEDYSNALEQWRGAFDMVLNEDGLWSWDPFVENHHKMVDRYYELSKDWNRNVAAFNANARNVGRPLAADEDQEVAVLMQHKQGKSLREIAFMTGLSLQTVRTVVGRENFTDRTSKKRRKIAIDQHERAHWKAQKRSSDALPKRVQAVIETGQGFVKEAKGLGRGR
jgi:transposase